MPELEVGMSLGLGYMLRVGGTSPEVFSAHLCPLNTFHNRTFGSVLVCEVFLASGKTGTPRAGGMVKWVRASQKSS